MPAFMVGVLAGLSFLLEHLVFRIALGLGFGVASYVGLGFLMSGAISQVTSTFTGLPADVLAMVYLLGIDRCINLMFSAYTCRLSIVGMTALGAISRVVQVPPEA